MDNDVIIPECSDRGLLICVHGFAVDITERIRA